MEAGQLSEGEVAPSGLASSPSCGHIRYMAPATDKPTIPMASVHALRPAASLDEVAVSLRELAFSALIIPPCAMAG